MVAIKGALFKPTATPHPHLLSLVATDRSGNASPAIADAVRFVSTSFICKWEMFFLLLLFFVSFLVIVFLGFDVHFPISLLSPVIVNLFSEKLLLEETVKKRGRRGWVGRERSSNKWWWWKEREGEWWEEEIWWTGNGCRSSGGLGRSWWDQKDKEERQDASFFIWQPKIKI